MASARRHAASADTLLLSRKAVELGACLRPRFALPVFPTLLSAFLKGSRASLLQIDRARWPFRGQRENLWTLPDGEATTSALSRLVRRRPRPASQSSLQARSRGPSPQSDGSDSRTSPSSPKTRPLARRPGRRQLLSLAPQPRPARTSLGPQPSPVRPPSPSQPAPARAQQLPACSRRRPRTISTCSPRRPALAQERAAPTSAPSFLPSLQLLSELTSRPRNPSRLPARSHLDHARPYRSRHTRPCDRCRRRKQRCVVLAGGARCLNCELGGCVCEFLLPAQVEKRPRAKKAHMLESASLLWGSCSVSGAELTLGGAPNRRQQPIAAGRRAERPGRPVVEADGSTPTSIRTSCLRPANRSLRPALASGAICVRPAQRGRAPVGRHVRQRGRFIELGRRALSCARPSASADRLPRPRPRRRRGHRALPRRDRRRA